MNFALIIALLLLAANVHQYICDDSTNHEDFQTSFPSQLTRNPPPFPNLSVTKKNKMMPTKPHSITLLYLLAQAGDLHPNPGPNSSITQTPPQNYPFGSCRQEVHYQDHAIQCDECDHWYHTACMQRNDTSYEQLKSHSVLWFCSCCGLPNYSNCLFSSNISTSNPYSVLDTPADSRDQYPNMSDEPSTTFAPNPANTSTPERKNVTTKSKLRAMLINCNSVKSNNKIAQLQATIHATDRDIILLVETKLDSSISTYSFLPFNYEAIINDRNIHGGGVLIAVRTDIIADPQDKFNTACEIIWTKVHFLHKKAIYIASYYRPPNDHTASLEALHESLSILYRSCKTPASVILAGDFNLPDFNWVNMCSTNSQTAAKHNKLIEIIGEFGLTNMVNEPTRLDSGNILDLVLTSNSSLISTINTVTGMSDHEAILFDIDMNPTRKNKPPHKVYNYRSAKWESLKSNCAELTKHYFDRNPGNLDVNSNWDFFRQNYTKLMSQSIPSRMTKHKHHLPWITRSIIRLQRKRDKAHSKAKKTKRNRHWEKFKQLRKEVTKEVAKSYGSYINNIIGESLTTNPKQFWSFIRKIELKILAFHR